MIRSTSLQSLRWKIDNTAQIDDVPHILRKINFDFMVDISFLKTPFTGEGNLQYQSLLAIIEPRRKIREHRLHYIQ